jgi:hypothetical protein
MKKIKLIAYVRGINICIILEYAFRVDFGFLQVILLIAFITLMIIDLTTD